MQQFKDLPAIRGEYGDIAVTLKWINSSKTTDGRYVMEGLYAARQTVGLCVDVGTVLANLGDNATENDDSAAIQELLDQIVAALHPAERRVWNASPWRHFEWSVMASVELQSDESKSVRRLDIKRGEGLKLAREIEAREAREREERLERNEQKIASERAKVDAAKGNSPNELLTQAMQAEAAAH